MAVSSFDLPGDPGFPLNGFFTPPSGASINELRTYLTQLRHEIGNRIVELAFTETGPNKWWTCFKHMKYMNKTLVNPGR